MSIKEAKAKLPMPDLFARLGIGNKATKLCTCPLHKEDRPSFGIFKARNGEWKWKCFAGCGHGDEIDFLQSYWNVSRTNAVRQFLTLADEGI